MLIVEVRDVMLSGLGLMLFSLCPCFVDYLLTILTYCSGLMHCSVWGFGVAGFCKFWNLSSRILSMILTPNMICCVYLYDVLVSGDIRKFGRMASTKDERRKSLTLAGTLINPEQNFAFDLWHHRDRRGTTLEQHKPGFGFMR